MAQSLQVSAAPMTMISLTSTLASVRASRARLIRGLSVVALFTLLSGAVFAQTAQTDPNATDNGNANGRRGRRGQNADQTDNGGGGRGNFDPAQMQQQMMDRMKEQLGVTDDAEWKVITDRLTPVMELRRAAGGGGGFGFRGGMGGPGGGRGGRGGAANPEQDALRQAIQDKLPDAEIKARLERLRDARKANEEKLAKAQEDLRAVLSVRQEAMAVMFGLLP